MPDIWKPHPIEVYKHWIEVISDEASDSLSSWELAFIENISQRLEFSNLSEAQANKLEEIYTNKTS